MKIIGIVTRKRKSEDNHDIDIIYNSIATMVKRNNAIPIGLILEEDYKELIDICSGIIFQGGDDFQKYDFEAMKYAYEKDIPTLGICLGMQLMGVVFNGKLLDVSNHKKQLDYVHSVKLKKDSKIFNIFNKDIIYVNSRHKSAIQYTDLDTVGISSDGYIEAIEDKNKKFFLGVQWHPETMIYDENQNKIFDSFIKECD